MFLFSISLAFFTKNEKDCWQYFIVSITFTWLPMFEYCTFVRFVLPIFNRFVLQTHNLIPFTAKKKSKLNKLCANKGIRLLFSVFIAKIVRVTNYFTGYVWMMYYVSSINKISDIVKQFFSDNCLNFKFILWKVHNGKIDKSYDLI